MVFLKDINYKDIKTLKTEFFFFSPKSVSHMWKMECKEPV